MGQLLAGEVAYLLRWVARRDIRRIWLPPVVAAIVIAVGLSGVTPGPVLDPGPRWLFAIGAAVGVTVVSVALARRPSGTR